MKTHATLQIKVGGDTAIKISVDVPEHLIPRVGTADIWSATIKTLLSTELAKAEESIDLDESEFDLFFSHFYSDKNLRLQ